MLDDFFVRALLAGIGIALVAGPLGCFIVWRRLAYFGDTLAHSALLGVAIAFLLGINVTVAVFFVSAAIAVALLALQRRASLSSDSLLGLLSHSALAVGLVSLTLIPTARVNLLSFLFGDLLSVSKIDIAIVWIGGACVLAVVALFWKRLFAATVNRELAEAEGLKPDQANLVFMLLMAVIIAIAMKIVGALLITALLIIPAATARRFANGPEQMAVIAALLGALSVCGGLLGSAQWDTQPGPSIVLAGAILFALSLTSYRLKGTRDDQRKA